MPTLIPPEQKSPAFLALWLQAQAEERYGEGNWKMLYDRGVQEVTKLTGMKLTSKRDTLLFMSAFYFGISFAIPVAEAAQKARSIPGRLHTLFTKKD